MTSPKSNAANDKLTRLIGMLNPEAFNKLVLLQELHFKTDRGNGSHKQGRHRCDDGEVKCMVCHQQTEWQLHHCTRKRQLYIPPSHGPPARQQDHSTRERILTQLLVPACLSSQRTRGITIRKHHQHQNGHVGNSQRNPFQQNSGALGAKTTEQEVKEVCFPRLRSHFRSSPRRGRTGPR